MSGCFYFSFEKLSVFVCSLGKSSLHATKGEYRLAFQLAVTLDTSQNVHCQECKVLQTFTTVSLIIKQMKKKVVRTELKKYGRGFPFKCTDKALKNTSFIFVFVCKIVSNRNEI